MKSTKQILIEARALISEPHRWTKDAFARKALKSCQPLDPDADCWCASGALERVQPFEDSAYWELRNFCQGLSVPEFNDHPDTTHEDVLEAFDKAIAACQE